MTQHDKIKELFRDGKWHCKNELRDIYIFNAHKRMVEIEGRKNREEKPTGEFIFQPRPCEHGIAGQKDYLMVENINWIDPTPLKRKVIIMDGRAVEVVQSNNK